MVSVEVVNPTKQHLATYILFYFRPYISFSSSMKLMFSLKVSI